MGGRGLLVEEGCNKGWSGKWGVDVFKIQYMCIGNSQRITFVVFILFFFFFFICGI